MASLMAGDGDQTRQHIQQSEERVKQSINDVKNHANKEAKRARLLGSLKYESMNSRRTELKPAHEATYVSIFESLDRDNELDNASSSSAAATWRRFVQWLQSDRRIFWIQGKPGAGKSTLMKFLLQHKNTQRGVDKWSPNTLIVSHFFWKPGDILQKNLRGLLCSLVYQLLSANYDFLDHILSEFLLASNKDNIGDWEISELKSIFHSILLQCKRSIFFLIDGLDEATETEEILQFLDSFIDLHNIKICMSSRSEEIFLQKFSQYDGFKLHELTNDDMLQFASVGILENDRYPSMFIQGLRHLLVEKAEGVYLWLVLALESVKRGLRNNDEQHEIHLRLSKLPSRLEELYADMWSRLGDDKDIYQKEALRYFNLLLINQSLREQYRGIHGHPQLYFRLDLSPFQLMLTTNEKIKRNMLDKSYSLSVSELCKKCADTVKYISIKTAGLLDITGNGYSELEQSTDPWAIRMEIPVKIKKEFSKLSEHITRSVIFIHRTLLDFFRESEVGRKIMAQSRTQSTVVELGTIMLCQLRTMQHFLTVYEYPARLECDTPLHYFCSVLAQLLAEDSILKHTAIMHLLNASNDLFQAGLLPWDNRPDWYPRPSFDLLLINNPIIKEFMQSRVKGKGVPHATCLLREFLLARDHNCQHGLYNNAAQESMPPFYGDVNSAGICLYSLPIPIDPGAWIRPQWENIILKFATYESVMSLATKRVYTEILLTCRVQPCSLRDLIAALEKRPDLDKRTSFAISIEREVHGPWGITSEMTQLPDLLCTIFSSREALETNFLQTDPLDTKASSGKFVIMELNLKYLVERFLEFVSQFRGHKEQHLFNRARQLSQTDNCKPHVKALFFIQLLWNHAPEPSSIACYRFKKNIDVLADMAIKVNSSLITHPCTITSTQLDRYAKECERVDVSELSILADEKLGICRLEDMGYQTSQLTI